MGKATTKVKVKVVKDYKDSKKSLLFHSEEIHEVTMERAKELEAQGYVEIVKDEGKQEGKQKGGGPVLPAMG